MPTKELLTVTVEMYEIPIFYRSKKIGFAMMDKRQMPKSPDFKVILDFYCKGNFDKRKIKDYEVLKINLYDRKRI